MSSKKAPPTMGQKCQLTLGIMCVYIPLGSINATFQGKPSSLNPCTLPIPMHDSSHMHGRVLCAAATCAAASSASSPPSVQHVHTGIMRDVMPCRPLKA